MYCTCAFYVYIDLLTSMKGLHELEYQVIESCRVLEYGENQVVSVCGV